MSLFRAGRRPPAPGRAPAPTRLLAAWVGLGLLATGCTARADEDPAQVDAVRAPEVGACRMLTPSDVKEPTNATRVVACTEPHTAETYEVGELPAEIASKSYDDPAIAAWATEACRTRLAKFLKADESLMMRTVVSPVWFGPSKKAWGDGARWYRCDVVGGGPQSEEYLALPQTTRGLLDGRPNDLWMVCASGPTVEEAVKAPCTEPHDWRAVSTIKLGEPGDPYPGDQVVQERSHDFCSDQVAAYLGYPVAFDMGITWFGEDKWQAGNRRSVCWARTEL